MAFQLAIISRESFRTSCFYEKLIRGGFAAPDVIYGTTIHIMKLNHLASSLEKSICLIGNYSISESFFLYLSFRLVVYVQVVICSLNNKRLQEVIK